jgi:hypothetical protein
MRHRSFAVFINSSIETEASRLGSQYFVGSGSPTGHSISNHSSEGLSLANHTLHRLAGCKALDSSANDISLSIRMCSGRKKRAREHDAQKDGQNCCPPHSTTNTCTPGTENILHL